MHAFTLTKALGLASLAHMALGESPSVGLIEFQNFGYLGQYDVVSAFHDIDLEDCSCEVRKNAVSFSGPISPLNEEVSVHFRGPLELLLFAYYVSPDYAQGANSGNWTRLSYYDAASQTAENATFLTKAGDNSTCLGPALTFAGSDGTLAAQLALVLEENNKIHSQDEYVIFSNITCGKSALDGDCGVYRPGIPAFHGFYGAIKMFLFEFSMPTEDTVSYDEVSNYNMPAIWLLNAAIPRTAQYSTSANCSCWRSGCGEFDIFEVMNGTQANNLYSTIHDYQGTGDIELGLAAYGHLERDTEKTMAGGVVFDKNGNAFVFMSNNTSFDATIEASTVDGWISDAGNAAIEKLASVLAGSTKSKSKSKGGAPVNLPAGWTLLAGAFSVILGLVI